MEFTETQKQDVQENRDIAAFSYVWIFSVVVLFSRRDSQFIQFHAKQAFILFILSVLFYLVPYLSYANVLVFAAMITGFINANLGHYYEMPIVSDLVKHHITVGGIWNFTKETFGYCVNFIKRLFKKGPRIVVESGVDAISKIRGIDVLKVNGKVQILGEDVQKIETETSLMQIQLKNLEAELIINQHLLNLNFQAAPQNIQQLTLEILKQINLKNLKLTQTDFAQYLVFKAQNGEPVILIGNFGPESLTLIIANSKIKDNQNYDFNLNTWHGITISETDKRLKELLGKME